MFFYLDFLPKIHRGNLKEYIKNIENKKLNNGSHTIPPTTPPTQQIIAKSLKSPKQEVVETDELSNIFKKFDSKYKTDSEKECGEDNMMHDDDGGSPSQDSPNTEDSSSSVPKPMPRTSRNNSLQDSMPNLPMDANKVMPKPRPRTTASAYKVCDFALVPPTHLVFFLD